MTPEIEKRRSDGAGVVNLGSKRDEKFGVVRLEQWPEGYVLWIGGEIRYRSWADKTLGASR